MTVYVTVETFQGVLDNVRAYLTEESALDAEKTGLREMGITSPESREGKSDNGTSFIVMECELKP
jgi:hypothetical protein